MRAATSPLQVSAWAWCANTAPTPTRLLCACVGGAPLPEWVAPVYVAVERGHRSPHGVASEEVEDGVVPAASPVGVSTRSRATKK